MAPPLTLLLCLLTAAGPVVQAQQAKSTTSTTTVFLPLRPTRLGDPIYESVITAAPTETQYLLASQTDLRAPYTCGNDFTGAMPTHGPGTVRVVLGDDGGLPLRPRRVRLDKCRRRRAHERPCKPSRAP